MVYEDSGYQVLVLVEQEWVALTDPFLTLDEAGGIAYKLRLPFKVQRCWDDLTTTEVKVTF